MNEKNGKPGCKFQCDLFLKMDLHEGVSSRLNSVRKLLHRITSGPRESQHEPMACCWGHFFIAQMLKGTGIHPVESVRYKETANVVNLNGWTRSQVVIDLGKHPSRRTSRVSWPQILEDCVTKFAPHRALQLIA